MKLRNVSLAVGAIAAFLVLCPEPALAYVGPGAGLSALGALLALVAGVIVGIFGFVWYPVKRLLRKRKPVLPPDEDLA